MSRMITKLLLSIATIAAATGVLLGAIAYALFVEAMVSVAGFLGVGCSTKPGDVFFFWPFFWIALASVTFIGLWTLIWRKAIHWTPRRRWMTLVVTIECIAAAAVCGHHSISEAACGLSGLLITTVPVQLALIWRYSRSEEAEFMERVWMTPRPLCPYCLGRLGGPPKQRCPYCAGELTAEAKP